MILRLLREIQRIHHCCLKKYEAKFGYVNTNSGDGNIKFIIIVIGLWEGGEISKCKFIVSSSDGQVFATAGAGDNFQTFPDECYLSLVFRVRIMYGFGFERKESTLLNENNVFSYGSSLSRVMAAGVTSMK